ncbi:MAG TPA: hypothetical protein VE621_06330 [Bryobacteraceae bacterium]|nr:hypothetical protein [Bryobacteraceae bacterium]
MTLHTGAFLILGIGLFVVPVNSQTMYIYSDIAVDESTGNVTINASTSTDYNSAYYYDIGVQTELTVQPEGSGSYKACMGGTSSNTYFTSLPPCTINVGSQSADLNLETFHWLSVTYFYYQLLPCSWECNYYGDYYGFSLISTPPSYTDNQYFYAPGTATPVAQQNAKSGWIQRSKRKGVCFYPTSEATTSSGWSAYHPYVGQFLQSLNGGSFNGRNVQEVFTGTAVDQCWRPQNGGQPLANPITGLWSVRYIKALNASGTDSTFLFLQDNAWGYDNVGFYGSANTILYNYVTNMRPTNGTCMISFNQNMYMYCSTVPGPGQYYVTNNPLALYISATPSNASLTSSRGSASMVRQYP